MRSILAACYASFVRSRFASPEGDHVTLLNVFRAYANTKQKKVWCHENFLHHRNLEYATEVRQQLATLAERANLEKASCGTNTEQLRKALLDGLYDNLAELQRDQTYITVSSFYSPVSLFFFYFHSIATTVDLEAARPNPRFVRRTFSRWKFVVEVGRSSTIPYLIIWATKVSNFPLWSYRKVNKCIRLMKRGWPFTRIIDKQKMMVIRGLSVVESEKLCSRPWFLWSRFRKAYMLL